MIVATDLKGGTTFLFEGRPFVVTKYAHVKVGRGGATVRVCMRSLETGDLAERSFNATAKFDEIDTIKRPMQYLYNDGKNAVFMDSKDYSQVEIDLELLGDSIYYIKEGSEVNVLFWGDKPLNVEIPPKVNLKVVETAPGIKGNSATNIYKPAKLENGLSVKVPLFIKVGEEVRVDTRTGDYIERVNG